MTANAPRAPARFAATRRQRRPDISLPALIAALVRLRPQRCHPQRVSRLLAQTTVAAAELSPYLLWETASYTRNLIYTQAEFELLAVCWAPQSSSPVHDHAGQHCWLRLVTGRLRLENFSGERPGRPGRRRSFDLLPGQVDHRDGRHNIHRVSNCAAWQQPAMGLHVYARPLRRSQIYDATHPTGTSVPMRYHSVFGVVGAAPPDPQTM